MKGYCHYCNQKETTYIKLVYIAGVKRKVKNLFNFCLNPKCHCYTFTPTTGTINRPFLDDPFVWKTYVRQTRRKRKTNSKVGVFDEISPGYGTENVFENVNPNSIFF